MFKFRYSLTITALTAQLVFLSDVAAQMPESEDASRQTHSSSESESDASTPTFLSPSPNASNFVEAQDHEALKQAEIAQYRAFVTACQQVDAEFSADISSHSAQTLKTCRALHELCSAPTIDPKIDWKNTPRNKALCQEIAHICQTLQDYPSAQASSPLSPNSPSNGKIASPNDLASNPNSINEDSNKDTIFKRIHIFTKQIPNNILAFFQNAFAEDPEKHRQTSSAYDLFYGIKRDNLLNAIDIAKAHSNDFYTCQSKNCLKTLKILDTYAAPNDDALHFLLNSAIYLRENNLVTRESILDEEIASFFSSSLPSREKIAVYASLLDELIEYAQNSDAWTTQRNLYETKQSLIQKNGSIQTSISCEFEESTHRQTAVFPYALLRGENNAIRWETHLQCPDLQEGISPAPTTGVPQQPSAICKSFPEFYTENFQLSEKMANLLRALRAKDNTAISEGILSLAQSLDRLSNHLQPIPKEAFCPIQTAYLMALSQDRFAELAFLEPRLKRIWHDTFPERLQRFPQCIHAENPETATLAARLLEENGDNYAWVTQNFLGKNKKNIDKSFKKWTKSRKTSITAPRRLLASWTSWTTNEYARANAFGGDFTKNKSRIAHPQLHSYALMLRIANGDLLDENTFPTYVQTIMLKTASLPYQTLTVVAPFLSKDQKQFVTTTFRDYSPANSPTAAAYFFIAYSPEILEPLSGKRRVALYDWLERELHSTLSPRQLAHFRLKAISVMAQNDALSQIASRAKRYLSETPLRPDIQNLWNRILCHAETDDASCTPIHEPQTQFDACMMPYLTDTRDFLVHAADCM